MSLQQDKPLSTNLKLTSGTKTSTVVDSCQVCGNKDLENVIFFGYMPPVNQMRKIGDVPFEQPAYPAGLLRCKDCDLVQISLIVDPTILFPPEYPYTSGTTKILHDNFDDLAQEVTDTYSPAKGSLVVDVGSNDGTLLSKFQSREYHVCGVEPTDVGDLAIKKGIPTVKSYFGKDAAQKVQKEHGKAKFITAANVFAHIEDIHAIVDAITSLLDDDGIFISENHYLMPLLETVQYDTVYHEHLRYYSVNSLRHLLEKHGLEIIKLKKIPSHGGSIRVYSARKGKYPIDKSVKEILSEEPSGSALTNALDKFKQRVVASKLELMKLLCDLKKQGKTICAISAPSRASTLVNYVGLDDNIIDYVAEISGSLKIGKYMPGTLIPVINQDEVLFGEKQPDYALILSWHIADELMPKLRNKGYKGKFIVPLPEPKVY